MNREFILTPEREDFIQAESNEIHFNCRGAAFLMQRKCKNPIERMNREFILTPEREDFIQAECNEIHFNC